MVLGHPVHADTRRTCVRRGWGPRICVHSRVPTFIHSTHIDLVVRRSEKGGTHDAPSEGDEGIVESRGDGKISGGSKEATRGPR